MQCHQQNHLRSDRTNKPNLLYMNTKNWQMSYSDYYVSSELKTKIPKKQIQNL